MNECDALATYDAFQTHSLPKVEWTHHAHLAACWSALQCLDGASALVALRAEIRSYNEATGVSNTDSSGYHETLTRYYVGAVASQLHNGLPAVLSSDVCDRSAPATYWSRDRLFTPSARLGWVEPDRQPLPWTTSIAPD
ncbi:MAG: hypothetical protein AB8G14_13325 [Ilumatobacter sp.]